MHKHILLALAAGLSILLAQTAHATFHLMQIEQVIGGANGDTSVQAIQLRMRANGQNLVAQSRLRVVDAQGMNPIILVDIAANVPNGGVGSRVLIASANFASQTSPAAVPDFPLVNLIPDSYMAAGSLTFESDTGTVYWRLSWGGAAYTGPNNGNSANDPNSNFGPPWPGPLPSMTLQALQFQGTAAAASSSNAADYALTAGAATFINNAGTSFVVSPNAVGSCCLADLECLDAVTEQECIDLGGSYEGDFTECENPTCPLTCYGDVVKSGFVDIDDLFGVIAFWGTPNSQFDIAPKGAPNGNVDIDDLFAIIAAWGPC
jgi:hypothetical protein